MDKVVSVFGFSVILGCCVESLCAMFAASWVTLPEMVMAFLAWFAVLVIAGVFVLGVFWRKR